MVVKPYVVIIPSKNPSNLRKCTDAFDSFQSAAVIWDGDENVFPSGVDCRVIARGLKPFVFAHNVNIGIKLFSIPNIILLNDDAVLETPDGFDILHEAALSSPKFGILVPQIRGVTSCLEQRYCPDRLKSESVRTVTNHMVPFMCAYIRRDVIKKVGLLDEDALFDSSGNPTYTGEDDLYCARVRKAGYKLGIVDSVVVEHGSLPSSFRTNPDGTPREIDCGPSRELYIKKFGRFPA